MRGIYHNEDLTTQVFESTDGGKTVYVREAGSTDREIYQRIADKYYREKMVDFLDDVFVKADSDPALKELLDKLVMYYNLKYGSDKT